MATAVGQASPGPAVGQASPGPAVEQAPPRSAGGAQGRYENDFEHLDCLGRGGYGVVFKAKHIIDKREYAVKRIILQSGDDNVLGEVQRLARLEHPGIVRYHQAWVEEHPVGWQGQRDRDTLGVQFSGTATPTPTSTPTSTPRGVPVMDNSSSSVQEFLQNANNAYCPSSVNPLRPSGGWNLDFVRGSNSSGSESWASDFDANSPAQSSGTDSGPDDNPPAQLHNSFQQMNLTPEPQPEHRRSSGNSGPASERCTSYLYIQMELCRVETLKDWLLTNTIDRCKHQCCDFVHQMVCAVQYIHEQGLVHRDLKPGNIFFSSVNGSLKIGDFGLATEEVTCTRPPQEQSDDGAMGTDLYMSPEMSAGQPYSKKVDLYAMGIIIFEVYYPVNTGMERGVTLRDVRLRQHKFPPTFRQQYPDVGEFVTPLLSHKAHNRPDCSDLLQTPLLRKYKQANDAHRRILSEGRVEPQSAAPTVTPSRPTTTPDYDLTEPRTFDFEASTMSHGARKTMNRVAEYPISHGEYRETWRMEPPSPGGQQRESTGYRPPEAGGDGPPKEVRVGSKQDPGAAGGQRKTTTQPAGVMSNTPILGAREDTARRSCASCGKCLSSAEMFCANCGTKAHPTYAVASVDY